MSKRRWRGGVAEPLACQQGDDGKPGPSCGLWAWKTSGLSRVKPLAVHELSRAGGCAEDTAREPWKGGGAQASCLYRPSGVSSTPVLPSGHDMGGWCQWTYPRVLFQSEEVGSGTEVGLSLAED